MEPSASVVKLADRASAEHEKGVPSPDLAALTRHVEQLERELADCLEQLEARIRPAPHETRVDELFQQVEHGAVRSGANRLGSFHREAPGKDRKSGKQPPGPLVKERDAPRNHLAKRLLTGRQVARTAGQHRQSRGKSCVERSKPQRPHASGRELHR